MPPRRPKIVLATFGAHGDIFPFLGVAERLLDLGCDPVLATSTYYESLIQARSGMGVKDIMALAQRPIDGPKLVLERALMPCFEQTLQDTLHACRGADLIVSRVYSFAAPWPPARWACPGAR